MIDEADRDGDGEVNEQEFLRIMKKTSLYWYVCCGFSFYTVGNIFGRCISFLQPLSFLRDKGKVGSLCSVCLIFKLHLWNVPLLSWNCFHWEKSSHIYSCRFFTPSLFQIYNSYLQSLIWLKQHRKEIVYAYRIVNKREDSKPEIFDTNCLTVHGAFESRVLVWAQWY